MQITRIPAEREDSASLQNRLRVAYYPRVSSKSFEQLLSLNNMITEAKKEAADNNWELVDIYADEGISGVNAKNRPQLKRLLMDCKAGKIDKVIVKSVSRLGRNVVELMEIANSLRETGVAIFFDTDKIDTSNGYDPMLLSMKAMIAETESRNMSQNMQWSVWHRFQEGTYIQSTDPYGYYHDVNGQTHIEPYEANVIKLIFQKALEGCGANQIASFLNDEHYLTRSYKPWCQRTVIYILRNSTYTGDTVWQKRYTEADVFPFHRVENKGELPKYLVSDIYKPLISKDDFEAVQIMLDYEKYKLGLHEEPFKNVQRYLFTGKIECQCGATFKRRNIHGIVKWACKRHLNNAEHCDIKAVREEYIEQAFVRVRNRLCTNLYLLEELYEELKTYRKVGILEKQTNENRNELSKLAEESVLYNRLYAQEMIDSAFYIQKTQELENKARQCHDVNAADVEEEVLYTETAKMIKYIKKIESVKEWFDPQEFDVLIKKILMKDNKAIHFSLMNDLIVEEKIEVIL